METGSVSRVRRASTSDWSTLYTGIFESGDATSEGSHGDNVATSGDILATSPGTILQVYGGTFTAGLAHAANGIYRPIGAARSVGPSSG